MSMAVLCQVKRAEHPFYIRDIDLNIYSIEELCYFADHNLALVEEDFFDDALIGWIGEELEDRNFVRSLERIRREGVQTLGRMLHALNAETGWIYVQDRENFEKTLEANRKLPGPERLRLRADSLVGYGKYTKAIEDYKRILAMKDMEGLGEQFLGTVYNNMGVTYARLFEMDEAVECLREAYNSIHSRETVENYLCAVYLAKGEEAFEKLADDLKADTGTRESLAEEIRNLKVDKPEGDVNSLLSGWVREYHRETAR